MNYWATNWSDQKHNRFLTQDKEKRKKNSYHPTYNYIHLFVISDHYLGGFSVTQIHKNAGRYSRKLGFFQMYNYIHLKASDMIIDPSSSLDIQYDYKSPSSSRKTSGCTAALLTFRALCSLRWSNTSTSTEKMELTGRWSDSLMSARSYESCFIPFPSHSIRSHLHDVTPELLAAFYFAQPKIKSIECMCHATYIVY